MIVMPDPWTSFSLMAPVSDVPNVAGRKWRLVRGTVFLRGRFLGSKSHLVLLNQEIALVRPGVWALSLRRSGRKIFLTEPLGFAPSRSATHDCCHFQKTD